MNATVPAPRPQIQAGATVAALVPQTLDEAFRVAQAIAASGMAPRGMEKPEQIMVAIMAGAELGFAPFQSLQSFAVVNGRPTLWGDGLVAVIRRNGCSIREWHEGETAFCEVTRPDTGETITRSFSQADAIKAGLAGKTGPWQQYPQRMRAMRARAWAGRDGCADMLRGFEIAEEASDFTETVRDITPKTTGMRARLEARTAAPEGFSAEHVAREVGGEAVEAHDAETGGITGTIEQRADDADPGEQVGAFEPVDGAETLPVEAETDTGSSADYDSPAEWLADARRWLADAEDSATVSLLNKNWDETGRWLALRAYSAADHADFLAEVKARSAELKKAEASQ